MKKIRVYELARELSLSSEALVKMLKGMDVPVKSHMSTVDESTMDRIRDHLSEQREEVKKDSERKKRMQAEIERKKVEAPKPAPKPAPAAAARPAPRPPTRPDTGTPPASKPAPPAASKPAPATSSKPAPSRPAPSGRDRSPSPAARGGGGAPAAVDPGADARKKRRRNRKRRSVDQAAVQRNVRETLATMETGKRRQKRRKEQRGHDEAATEQAVRVTEFMTLGEVASLFGVDPMDVIKHCMGLGIMANINKRLDKDVIELLAEEFEVEIEFGQEYGAELVEEIQVDESDKAEVHRSPVVTVMGHVDHGKTSLLDYIRNARVAAGEAGGITQHIGAYAVEAKKGRIVFLDTPGHEAFTAMRARGAETTDIVVLVVAADDGVMPQTIEAIDHAKAAGVPIVVAVNKVDLPDAKPERMRQEVSQYNVVPEEWGGDTIFVDVSAKTGQGIEHLLDTLLLVSEMKELTASPDRMCRGTVVEAHVDRGRGVVATVLIQDGTVRVGDSFVCGNEGGKVRAIHDDRGRRIERAGPSTPVEILGWSGPPQAGDTFQGLRDDQAARDIMLRRQQISREQRVRRAGMVNLASLHQQIEKGELQTLNVIIKADTQGSVEVLCDSFEKLGTDEVRVNIIHRGVGAINESDVLLAAASQALIFGFHVKREPRATSAAEREEVEIRLYDVIYEAVNDVTLAMEGLLKPEEIEHIRAEVEVKQIFRIPKRGTIAGSYVASGKATVGSRVKVVRDGEVVHVGRLASLKRFKDDVKEVENGLECGLSVENFDKIQPGDRVVFFETEQVLRKIS